jgi:hypothetical protein
VYPTFIFVNFAVHPTQHTQNSNGLKHQILTALSR